ncbi:MAG: hypothetical protein U9O94_08705, partial [Nanoarchaeota archaeon]|nr:hypothetical protein [Nanoarchaeota archaeon]
MAVTVSVTATKIDITSTDGVQETWDTCVTAINAHTAGTVTGTGTSGDPYTITAASYRELEFSSGVKVKFVAGTYTDWQWGTTSGTYVIFDASSGCEIEIEQGCNFNFGSTGTYKRGYVYLYGKVTAQASSGNEIVFENYRSMYIYSRDTQVMDYVFLKNCTYSSGYMIYLGLMTYTTIRPVCSYTNFKVFNDNHGL